jgi:hypothetical protein
MLAVKTGFRGDETGRLVGGAVIARTPAQA